MKPHLSLSFGCESVRSRQLTIFKIGCQAIAGARGIDVAPNGDLLVLSRSGTPRVLAVYEDSNGDAQTTTLATLSGLNHAVKYRDGYVYASSDTTVYRYENGYSGALQL